MASRWLYSCFHATSTAFRVRYIRRMTDPEDNSHFWALVNTFPRWLAFGVCSFRVYRALEESVNLPKDDVPGLISEGHRLRLPRGFMRRICAEEKAVRLDCMKTLSYLRTPRTLSLPIEYSAGTIRGTLIKIPLVDINSLRGYMLSRAVRKGFDDLVRELLAMGANPMVDDGRAVRLAIGMLAK